MIEIKFRYTIKRENMPVFSKIFDIREIENGDVLIWLNVNHSDKDTIIRDQYTEKKDKNGVEIYGSDILKHDQWGIIGNVFYDNGMYRVSHDEIDLFLNHAQLETKCIVIGNIHENI